MPAKSMIMVRYAGINTVADIEHAIAAFAVRTGRSPTIAHVSPKLIHGHAVLGNTQLMRAWGLQAHEIDLGPIGEDQK